MGQTPKAIQEKLTEYFSEPIKRGETRGYCPLCEEVGSSNSPSGSFNFQKNVFHCFAGCGGMSIPSLVGLLRADGWVERNNGQHSKPAKESESATRRLPTEERLEKFVDDLFRNKKVLQALMDRRGLTERTIEEFQIGWHQGRYTIPIRDEEGELVNVRRYLLTARDPKDKMMSWSRGHGGRRLYLPEVLENNEEVILCEGEMDTLVAQQHGLPAMTHTAGAQAWSSSWSPEFQGKTVYICYDVDEAGRRGARKVQDALRKFAKAVYIIELPLQERGADLTNYFVDQGHTLEEFKELMRQARSSSPTLPASSRSDEPIRVNLESTMSSDTHEKKITFVATVAGKVQPVFMMPKEVEYNCNEGGGTRCGRCPISGRNHLEISVREHDPVLLDLVDQSREASNKIMLKHVGIPSTCPDVEITEAEVFSMEELIVVPPADEQVGSVNPIDRRVYNVGQFNTPVNSKACFVGTNTTGRKNRRAALQTWVSEPTATALDTFKMSEEIFERLSVFWPQEDQTPLDKLYEIAADLEANVTRIYNRPLLHIAYDLVWHSVLGFRLKGHEIGKGWLELLVVGDTRTGKSEAANRLCHHYRAGVLTTCEGATFAGLVGGAQQLSNTWMVSWGTIPLNDRRLVVLDEFSGISEKGILEQMSSIRSSGVAQINKIVKQETAARTRLIWIANPADGSTVEDFANGAMDAIRGLAKNPEDIARFDFAMAVARGDVRSEDINTKTPPKVHHQYTSEACSELVSWVWSRSSNQIKWDRGVQNYVLERAKKLGARYLPDPPLVQVENVRIKLARMACAVAARLFSCDDSGERLLVSREHVQAAEQLLDLFYGSDSFGYAEHSLKLITERREARRNAREVRNLLLARKDDVLPVLRTCMSGPFKMRDFEEFAGMSRIDAQEIVRRLQELRVIRRMSKGYIRAEPELVQVVKALDYELDK